MDEGIVLPRLSQERELGWMGRETLDSALRLLLGPSDVTHYGATFLSSLLTLV